MERKMLWVAFLVLFLLWISANARKIVIFERSGSLMITQEIFDLGDGIFVREESHGIVLGGDVQELVPGIATVKAKFAEGLSKMLNMAPYLSRFPLKDTVYRREERLAFQGFPFQLVCNACIEVSKQAEQILSDPETLENIEELVRSICMTLPSNFSAQCDEMSNMYIQETIAMLQDYLSEEKLCISTGLCNGNNNNDSAIKISENGVISPLGTGDDTICAVCEQFIEEAIHYVSQNKTQSEVLIALHQTCSKLKTFSTECDSLIDYYASLFFTEIGTISPKEFCQKISLCRGSASFLKQQHNCDICRAAISEIKTELEDPETKLKLIEMMIDGCKRVPAYAKECKKLVFEYGPLILTNMEKYLDSNDICSEIHVCEPLAGKLKNNMNVSSQPLIELTSSEVSNHASSK